MRHSLRVAIYDLNGVTRYIFLVLVEFLPSQSLVEVSQHLDFGFGISFKQDA